MQQIRKQEGENHLEEEVSSKIKYLGQGFIIFALGILVVLFRIAVPITIGDNLLSKPYTWVIGELVYMALEGGLIVVLVAHLIFRMSYKEMGLKDFKRNLPALVGNIIYLGAILAITYGLNFISGKLDTMNFVYILGHLVIYFMSTAFLQELIYRGCLLNCILKFTSNKVICSIIFGALLFTVVRVPLSFLQTDLACFFEGNLTYVIGVAFGLGLFLNVLYYVTDNIWLCMIIHATYISIDLVSEALLEPVFRIIYVIGCVFYLIFAIAKKAKKRKKAHMIPRQEEKQKAQIDLSETTVLSWGTLDETEEYSDKF